MRTTLYDCRDPKHDPTPPPPAAPYMRAHIVSSTIDGMGCLAIVPWASHLIIRAVHANEPWEGAGPRPVDAVTINGKAWRVDATVRRDSATPNGWKVEGTGNGWGLLINPTSFSRGGTESAERKARQAIEAWAERYAIEFMDGIGAENTRRDAIHHLSDTARVLADCYADVMATLSTVDGMDGAELATVNALPYDIRRNEWEENDQ